MSSKLMDTEPGGESTQYESIQTVTKPHSGQDQEQRQADTATSNTQENKESGERTAENARYGQAISESGFGGKTTEADGEANQGGYGETKGLSDADVGQSRREQGYRPGSGVGG